MTGWRSQPCQLPTREWSESAFRAVRAAVLMISLLGAGAYLAAAVLTLLNLISLILA